MRLHTDKALALSERLSAVFPRGVQICLCRIEPAFTFTGFRPISVQA